MHRFFYLLIHLEIVLNISKQRPTNPTIYLVLGLFACLWSLFKYFFFNILLHLFRKTYVFGSSLLYLRLDVIKIQIKGFLFWFIEQLLSLNSLLLFILIWVIFVENLFWLDCRQNLSDIIDFRKLILYNITHIKWTFFLVILLQK